VHVGELLDGRVVALRHLDAWDNAAIVALHQHLTDDENYFRFFTPRPAHLQQLVSNFIARDSKHCAIGAYNAGCLFGVANYVILDDPAEAEAALVVAHNEHQLGLGTAYSSAWLRPHELRECNASSHTSWTTTTPCSH
jgi:hypothetical protein